MQIENNLLARIELNPSTAPIGCVILLHGLGADGNDFVSIVPELHLPKDIPLRFVFPSAPLMPITINNGYVMPAWYDIVSMSIEQRADEKGLNKSCEQLSQLIEHEIQQGIPAEKIILAGFSQGAVVALATGVRFTKPLAGILALSGYLPSAETILRQADDANRNTPIFMAHGLQDAVVPYKLGQMAFDALEKNGFAAGWHSYAMGHSVCASEIHDIGEWLKEIFT
jgi:phospholipase/carboxylesterase